MDKMPLPSTIQTSSTIPKVSATTTTVPAKSCAASVIIENPDPAPDHSYAGILKGDTSTSTLTGKVQIAI